MLKKIAILGSTGSIGQSALDVIAAHPREFSVCALAAATSVQQLAAQAAAHPEASLCMSSETHARQLAQIVPGRYLTWGPQGLTQLIRNSGADIVLNAICGAAGLVSTLDTLKAGIDLALANKESLVMGGHLVMDLIRAKNLALLPVDSEHSALWQLGAHKRHIKTLWLTGSGGPFWEYEPERMAAITPDQALSHPRWRMGPKISIDSATMMNKGLEVIEAHHLFAVAYDNIKVAVHPQALVHGLVEMDDGAVMAHLAPADMRIPIAYALSHPRRLRAAWPTLEITALPNLSFASPDLKRFPALGLALAAGRAGGSAPTILNAANEEAILAFLGRRIAFVQIAQCVEEALNQMQAAPVGELAAILEADAKAREAARAFLRKIT
jgi:1-deoxy-D-xylulose-5-phosphate reductoisomerase